MREMNILGDFNFSDYDQRIMLDKDKNFTFGHFKVGPGFATIAAGRINNYLYYGITFCSPKDNFSKKVGRIYACRNLRGRSYSHMRGVIFLEGAIDETPPAVILKKAVESHLKKMCPDHRPQWSKGATVDFRNVKRK